MGLIDKHVKKIIELATNIPSTDIFNIYQLKGALPEKKAKNEQGVITLNPYSQQDMFILFGIEEDGNGGEAVIATDRSGAPENKIIITNRFKVKVLFNGEDSDFYSLKLKARLWSKGVEKYLEENNLTLHTQNPEISFETEEVAGEFWDKRGLVFAIVIELHFDDDEDEEIEKIGKMYTHET